MIWDTSVNMPIARLHIVSLADVMGLNSRQSSANTRLFKQRLSICNGFPLIQGLRSFFVWEQIEQQSVFVCLLARHPAINQ